MLVAEAAQGGAEGDGVGRASLLVGEAEVERRDLAAEAAAEEEGEEGEEGEQLARSADGAINAATVRVTPFDPFSIS
ncbi:MAG: hypothetical protein ACPGQD_04545, partial [Planctomycetota bacterium]